MSSSRQLKAPQRHAELTGFDACKQSLLSVIESQILPQLVLAHADRSEHHRNQASYGLKDRALGATTSLTRPRWRFPRLRLPRWSLHTCVA